MGGTLRFRELRGISNGESHRGARINDIDGLRDHVDGQLSESLALDTREGDEYPRYEYLRGLYYRRDDPPSGLDPYFIDNVYPGSYAEVFAGISEYTEPFVVLAAQSFPRLDELLDGVTRTPYLVHAADGEAERHEIEMPELPAFDGVVSDLLDDVDG